MRLIAFAIIALTAACAPAPVETTDTPAIIRSLSPSECAARGGAMTPVGRMQSIQCVINYADAGKRCTDGAQCQGDCRTEPDVTAREGQSVTGQCQANSNRFGCFTTVNGGKAEATLCID